MGSFARKHETTVTSKGANFVNALSACEASGTKCGRPFSLSSFTRFISALGIVHIPATRSTSLHSIMRTSPGR